MLRKDSEKDSERPHYYSQFWLDVAAGRTIIGGAKSGEELEVAEPEPAIEQADETALFSDENESDENEISDAFSVDGHVEAIVPPVARTIAPPEEFIEPEPEELEFEHVAVQDSEIPDMDFGPEEEEEQGEEEDFEQEEEEQEEEGWGARSSKKRNKPVRPPKPVKRPKRDPRRSGY